MSGAMLLSFTFLDGLMKQLTSSVHGFQSLLESYSYPNGFIAWVEDV